MLDIFIKYSAYLIWPLLALGLSLTFTKTLIFLLPKWGLVDQPGGRHIHKTPTPKGGGLAIFSAFFIPLILFQYSPWGYFTGGFDQSELFTTLFGAGALVLLGLADDKLDLPAWLKLGGQIAIAYFFWAMGFQFNSLFGFNLPFWLSCLITIGWIIAFINAFNLIDGMDGLAAGLGIVACISLGAVTAFSHRPAATIMLLILAASCLGFLRYNFHPARIFMGDTGSMFLGLMFAVIGIATSQKKATFTALAIPVLAMGVPFFDVLLAIWRRTTRKYLNRENMDAPKDGIMVADKDHLHHRLLDRNPNQSATAIRIYLIATCFGLLSLLMFMLQHRNSGLALLLMLLAVASLINRLASIELLNSTRLLIRGLQPSRKNLLLGLHPFLDIGIFSGSYLLIHLLLNTHPGYYPETSWYNATLYNILPPLVVLNVSRVYRRSWLHASARDYLLLANLLLIGHLFSTLSAFFCCPLPDYRLFLNERLFFMLLTSGLIIGERMFLRFLRATLAFQTIHQNSNKAKLKQVLLYGAGQTGEFYVQHCQNNSDSQPEQIVGLVDDNQNLHQRYLYGHQVLGGLKQLPQILQNCPFGKLVITSQSIPEDRLRELELFCRCHDLTLTHFAFREEPGSGLDRED